MGKFSTGCSVAVAFFLLSAISFAGGNPPSGVDCVATIPSHFQHGGKERKVNLELNFSGLETTDLSNCKVTATLQFGSVGSKLSKKFEDRPARYYDGRFVIEIWSSKPRKSYHVSLTDVKLETPEGKTYNFPEVYTNEAVVE
jgi:hypothetical protein